MHRPLPIGVSDFKELIEGGYIYVDKTLLIEEIIEKGTKAAFICRPRRFGKTLNLSMIRYFFEVTGEDTNYLFKNLNVWKNEKMRGLQGQFPVIFITFKDTKHASWEETFNSLRRLIALEFSRHIYLKDSLLPNEKILFDKILFEEGSDQTLLEQSLLYLSTWLQRYHKKRVILLVDEYDAPAHAAYLGGFYEVFISFLRNLLSAALKDNNSLERGVLTGILRIAKESIFSGLNNISTFTILNEGFGDKFGLLESEVHELLKDFDLLHSSSAFKKWYDGYRIGSCGGIYNPWSVLKCIQEKGALSPYWVNTSDNALVKQLIQKGSENLKIDIEELLRGGTIEKKVEEGIIFSELEKGQNTIWSLLLYSGYLTIDATPAYGTPCRLKIPNIEIVELYQSMILDWFEKSIEEHQYQLLLKSLVSGDIETFSQIFQDFLISSISAFDIPFEESEKIYHVFVLGILVGLKNRYEVKSNRESGLGRYDVILFPKDIRDLGIVMEFKKVKSSEKIRLEIAANSTIEQIEEKGYAQELLDRGVKRILYLGFAFKGKKVLIVHKFREPS